MEVFHALLPITTWKIVEMLGQHLHLVEKYSQSHILLAPELSCDKMVAFFATRFCQKCSGISRNNRKKFSEVTNEHRGLFFKWKHASHHVS